MPDLSDSLQCKNFLRRLEHCEEECQHAAAFDVLDSWELQFISDMRDKFETREYAMDLGMTPWSPTASQWNQLDSIHRKVGGV